MQYHYQPAPVNPETRVTHPRDQAVASFNAQSPLVVPEFTQGYKPVVVTTSMDQLSSLLVFSFWSLIYTAQSHDSLALTCQKAQQLMQVKVIIIAPEELACVAKHEQ